MKFVLIMAIYSITLRQNPQRASVFKVLFPKEDYNTWDCGFAVNTVYWNCLKIQSGDTSHIIIEVPCPNEIFGKIKVDSIYNLKLIDLGKFRTGKRIYTVSGKD